MEPLEFTPELKYEFKKQMKRVARENGFSPKFAYSDIAICPVCTQVEWKPFELWTRRELKHLSHISSIRWSRT